MARQPVSPRKNQIRAVQAAHPGMSYGVAAHQVDTAKPADLPT
ncbi:hypothetical protein [Amycolatopsis sp. lyj-108]